MKHAATTLAAALALLPLAASAQVVNWLDTASYEKPRPITVAVPNEASVSNKYYVDMTGGSGSTCSQVAPCASLTSVSGKAGTSGGPAYIYLKGNGYLNLTSSQLAGSTGNEIVIKPWPGDSTPAVMTAQGGCNVGNANTIAGSNTHHLIFDGGPDMLFRFVGSGCTGNQNGYTVVVKSNDITLHRVRINVNGSSGPGLGPGTGSGTSTARFRMYNSELYGATRYYGVYTGGGTGCGAADTSHTDMEFRNNIFRQIDGRGIQVEPRANSTGMTITGNVFYAVGYCNNCGMGISGAVQIADACGGTTSGVLVANNVMWDLGGGGVLIFVAVANDSLFKVLNNTIYDYANATPVTLNSHGITSWEDSASYNATVKNNIVLAPANGGVNALNRTSGWDESNNVTSGTVSSIFESTSTSSLAYLKLKSGSSAINAGTTVSDVTTDYTGKSRTVSGAYDVGAFEFGTSATRPKAPTLN